MEKYVFAVSKILNPLRFIRSREVGKRLDSGTRKKTKSLNFYQRKNFKKSGKRRRSKNRRNFY